MFSCDLVAQLGVKKYPVSLCYFSFHKQLGSDIQNDILRAEHQKPSPSPPELCRLEGLGAMPAARRPVEIHACFFVVGGLRLKTLLGTGLIFLRQIVDFVQLMELLFLSIK